MRRVPDALLQRMAARLSNEDRDEMAIPSYRHKNPALRWMAWRRLEVMARHLERACNDGSARDERVIVDFGCGTGVLLEEASRYARRVYGVDPVLDAARMLVEEWRLEKVTLLTPAEFATRVPEGSVDIIIAAEVLEHLEALDDTLALFHSRLKRDGRLLVSLPTENALYKLGRRLAGFHGHYHHAGAADIHEVIARTYSPAHLERVPPLGPMSIYWVIDYRPATRPS